MFGGFREEGKPRSQGESPLLGRVVQHRDDDLIEQARGPGKDIEVAEGHGIERTGAHAATGHQGNLAHSGASTSGDANHSAVSP